MSVLFRSRLLRRLQVVLGLALLGLVVAPGASAASPLDTVTATGTSGLLTPPVVTRFGPLSFFNINISAQSGTSGQKPNGTATLTTGIPSIGGLTSSGPVSCLNITGPDGGVGTVAAPTMAVLQFHDSTSGNLFTVALIDNGGNGLDTMTVSEGGTPSPAGCSLLVSGTPPETGILTNGRAVVLDTPTLPTSKEQCKNGGWRNFPQFKNQGQCVAFVEHAARSTCLAERTRIGRAAFRDKYGEGRDHRGALRRCIELHSG